MHLGLDEINKRTVEGLKSVSKSKVGVSVNKRTEYTRVYTNVKEITTTLKATRKCSDEVYRLGGLGYVLDI